MALPAPVARLARATAGRRALQLALLFGGLFVLGILCGGRAQADGLSDAGASGADSLRAGHAAVREHVADSVRKLRGTGSREAPATAESTSEPTTERPAQPAAEPEHMHAKAPATPAPAAVPAPPRDRIATPERQAAPAATPSPADAPSSTDASSSADAPSPAADLASIWAVEQAPTPVDVRHAAHAVRHKASVSAESLSAESLRERLESVRGESLGDGRARLGAAVDAVRYLTAPVGAAVHRLTGPVEELATRAVADLVAVVPGQLPDVGLGGLVDDIVDPANHQPQPPAATTPHEANASAEREHGERPTAAQATDRSHAAASDPQAYDVARFGDGQKAEAGARAEARPAAPVVPQRPDGVPSAGASAGDGGSSRHGDLHAAAFGDRAPVLLASGATASGGTAPVVDRLREVPEFPG
ncbi:hypothetical protein [Streptomyces sp. NPDC051684]|uniref:hypothetical protein n=1 Tax=Streptomyces sp. NPDC051684 TaxID=3365670 RepID=UPI0037BCFB83